MYSLSGLLTVPDSVWCAQIVNRPRQGHKFLSRLCVQPQWVVDIANFSALLLEIDFSAFVEHCSTWLRVSIAVLQIVDRPTQGHKFLSRQYVQPQWVFDSANFRVLAKAELYAVGLVPPPHLSPFTQADDEGYVPDYMKTMLQLQV